MLIWVSWLVSGAEQGSITPATAAAAGNFVGMGGAKIWYEECGANARWGQRSAFAPVCETDFSFPVQRLTPSPNLRLIHFATPWISHELLTGLDECDDL